MTPEACADATDRELREEIVRLRYALHALLSCPHIADRDPHPWHEPETEAAVARAYDTLVPGGQWCFAKDPFAAESVAAEAARDVLAERERQRTVEGWSTAHDDRHLMGQLAQAAACYAAHPDLHPNVRATLWPWNGKWWKPEDRRRDLVKAGALILAEIERLDRVRLCDTEDRE